MTNTSNSIFNISKIQFVKMHEKYHTRDAIASQCQVYKKICIGCQLYDYSNIEL